MPTEQSTRRTLRTTELTETTAALNRHLDAALSKNGYGAFVSRHELLGALTEEYHEALDALHSEPPGIVRGELLDIAVACLFGVASLDARAFR